MSGNGLRQQAARPYHCRRMHIAGPCQLDTLKADLMRSRERLVGALLPPTDGEPPSEARSFLLDLALLSLDAAVEAIDEVMDEFDGHTGG